MPAKSTDIDSDQENMSSSNSLNKNTPQERILNYRNLLNKIENIEETDDVGLNTVNEIGDVLREVNVLDNECKIDDRVEHADETFLDCMVLSSASNILKKCIEAVDVFASTYEQTEFTDKIIRYIKDDDEDEIKEKDLLKFLGDARQVIPQVPQYTFVYGAYDLNQLPQPKEKKERQKATKEKFEKKEPEKVTSLNKEEEGIEEIVKHQHEILMKKFVENQEVPIKYYDFVIDTDDFATTVENIFYFSFLVRDGKAEIDLNGIGEPVIKPIQKNLLKRFRDKGGVNTQIITYITMDQWKNFKKKGYLQENKNPNVLDK